MINALLFEAVASENSSGTDWVPTIVSIIALAISIWTFLIGGRRERLDRQRQVFAEAMEAVMTYREYPFIVYRRNPDEEAKERLRISTELSALQARLNGFKGRLLVEDPVVGKKFTELLNATRRVAGTMIKQAWDQPPATADGEMHNPGWNFDGLEPYDQAYLEAVADHLDWAPTTYRRWSRS